MIFNGEDIGIGNVEATYLIDMVIPSKDNLVKLFLGFNPQKYEFKEMSLNERIDIIEYLYWDVSLGVNGVSILFDISKDKVFVTRLEDNRFRIEIDVENPDIIYCYEGSEPFTNLKIDTEFSFMDSVK